jgi:hypothetical protein
MVRSTGDHWSALKRALAAQPPAERSRLPDPAIRVHAGGNHAAPGRACASRVTATVFGMDAPSPQDCPALRPSALFATPTAKISADAPFACNSNTSVLALPLIRSRRQHARWSASHWMSCRFHLFRHLKATRQAGIAPTRTYRRSYPKQDDTSDWRACVELCHDQHSPQSTKVLYANPLWSFFEYYQADLDV